MAIISLRRFASLLAASAMVASTLAACSGAGDVADTATDAASSVTEGGICAADIPEIEFGIISTESADNLKPNWEPLLADMSESIGRPVKGFYATDYAGVIEGMGAGKVQVAWYGG